MGGFNDKMAYAILGGLSVRYVFFFFQAEDGIRDIGVTGVQTCALPISLQLSLGRHVAIKVLPAHGLLDPKQLGRFQREARSAAKLHHTNIVPVFGVGERSEERRVGKECRSRWSPYH